MISKIKNFFMTLASAGALLFPTLAPATVFAHHTATHEGLCQGIELDPTTGECGKESESKIGSILKTVIDIFSLVVGFTAVIMIIVGGFKYITAGGDSGNVTAAKNTILYAVVGLVVVALAQFIVRFVIEKVG